MQVVWKQQTGSSSNQNVDPAYIYPQQHTPAPSEDYVTDGYQQPEILTSKALKINGVITYTVVVMPIIIHCA